MKNKYSKAVVLLKEISRDWEADSRDLSPLAVADSLQEYWDEYGAEREDYQFLTELRAEAKAGKFN